MLRYLKERIRFERVSQATDGIGGVSETWAALASNPDVYAGVMAMSGNERLENGALNAAGTYRFTIRYREDVTERDRIVWRSETYNIRTVARHTKADGYLEIVAERGVAQ